MDTKSLWQAVLGEMEVKLSRANFRTWFKNTHLQKNEDGSFVVATPTGFVKEWLQNKYHHDIKEALLSLGEVVTSLDYAVGASLPKQEEKMSPSSQESETIETVPLFSAVSVSNSVDNKTKSILNPKYVFASFLPSNNNKLAYSAAKAVAQNPGTAYNPLLIYGSVGLGKTHLMHAIGNEILQNNPKSKIVYCPCERFVNEMIDAIRTGTMEKFKSKYRKVDVLMIDDAQFLAGKSGSQEEFFHTFNDLHERNKQIILSSDRPPKDIETLEERLRSRFEWGMIADVQAPDLETRTAILKLKADEQGFKLPESAFSFIAESVKDNIRKLEGVLTRIIAQTKLLNTPLSLEEIKEITAPFASASVPETTSEEKILKSVLSFYNITKQELLGTKRNAEIVLPRQVAMFFLRALCSYSFPKIAKTFKGKDHTTVMHACEKIEKKIKEDGVFEKEIELIKERISET